MYMRAAHGRAYIPATHATHATHGRTHMHAGAQIRANKEVFFSVHHRCINVGNKGEEERQRETERERDRERERETERRRRRRRKVYADVY